MKCSGCHAQAETGDRAGFPNVAACRVCHVDIADREIPARRVYELPDFVFFSHARHASARIECRSCHGEVTKQDSVRAEFAMKMKWCVDCHKPNRAAITCSTCHELGQ